MSLMQLQAVHRVTSHAEADLPASLDNVTNRSASLGPGFSSA